MKVIPFESGYIDVRTGAYSSVVEIQYHAIGRSVATLSR